MTTEISNSAHQALADHFATIASVEAELAEAKANRLRIDEAMNGPELTGERLKRLVSEGAETLAAWIAGGAKGKRPILDEERHSQLSSENEQATLEAKAAAQLVSDAETQISEAEARLATLHLQTEAIAAQALVQDATDVARKYKAAMDDLANAYVELHGLNRCLARRGLQDLGADAMSPNMIFQTFRVPGVFDAAHYAGRRLIPFDDGKVDLAAADWSRQLFALTQGQADTNDQAA